MKLIYLVLATTLLAACGGNASAPDGNNPDVSATGNTETSETTASAKGLGSFVGMFVAEKFKDGGEMSWANRINISIDKIEGNTISGHSVVAGNDRPFSGTFTRDAKTGNFSASVQEPGDDKYDGKFSFNYYTATDSIIGTWKANDTKLQVTERSFALGKRVFKYDPSLALPESVEWDGLYGTWKETRAEALTNAVTEINASNTVLKKADVENLYKSDLEVIRNAIYARHGYSFKNRKMRYVFDQVEWYIPVNADIRQNLTPTELANIELLKRFEEHAAKYYDDFGR